MDIDGGALTVRPIEPGDADALVRFHAGLSLQSTRLRFFTPHPRLSEGEVEQFTRVDHHRREALVALAGDDLVAVARFERLDDSDEAEVAFVVADEWQHHGIGSELLRRLVVRAREEGVRRFVADTLADNHLMISVFEHSGLPVTRSFDCGVVHVEFPIN